MMQARQRRDRMFALLCVAAAVLALAGPVWMLIDVFKRALPVVYRYEIFLPQAPETSLRRDKTLAPLLSDAAFDVRPVPGQPAHLMLSADADGALKHDFADVRRILQVGHFTLLPPEADGTQRAVGLPVAAGVTRIGIGEGMFLVQQALGNTLTLRPVIAAPPGDYAQRVLYSGAAVSRLSAREVALLQARLERGEVRRVLNTQFLTATDSRHPELAGIYGALWGSLLSLAVAFVLSVPAGVAAALYAEFGIRSLKMRNRLEVATANMAAVPSVLYGLLGAAVFLQGLAMPRSSPLVGGCVLALIMMPIVLTAAREALRAVSPSLLQGALALGATPMQAVLQQVLPPALPGILTGILLASARAAGESAPLLMVGMAAFIADAPHGLRDAATVLPVQIFLWANNPERGFVEKTAAAVLLLVAALVLINLLAARLQRRASQA